MQIWKLLRITIIQFMIRKKWYWVNCYSQYIMYILKLVHVLLVFPISGCQEKAKLLPTFSRTFYISALSNESPWSSISMQLSLTGSPAVFPDRVSGLCLIHEQLTGIDNHICNLQMTWSELFYGVNQLCPPASIIPTEVLLYIFCQLGGPGFILLTSEHRYDYIHQSVVLTSVLCYWCWVALETPEL
jgi:hypothetical protein